LSIEGSSDRESFGLYLRELLCPRLKPGRIVVMDNLSVHKKGAWVRELIEGRGCTLVFLPSYSPDFNPIEEAFSKVKNSLRKARARTLGALFEATHRALSAVTAVDVGGYFEHCGYGAPRRRQYERCSRLLDQCGAGGVKGTIGGEAQHGVQDATTRG
jgi:transposase